MPEGSGASPSAPKFPAKGGWDARFDRPPLDGIPIYADGRPFRMASGEEFGRPIFFYVPDNAVMLVPDGLGKRFRTDDYLAGGLHLISTGKVEKLRADRGGTHDAIRTTSSRPGRSTRNCLSTAGRSFRTRGTRAMPDIPPGVPNLPATAP